MFAVYLPLGDGDRDVASAADVLESVAAYSRHLRWVVLIDDAREPRDLAAACHVPDGCQLIVLRNPRQSTTFGRTGGLCVADLVAFDYLARATTAAFALKLDTDSLVIGPFEQHVTEMLDAHDDAGLLGVIGDSFGENRRYLSADWNRQVLEGVLSLPDSYEALTDRFRAMVSPLGPLNATVYADLLSARQALVQAVAHGYPLGHYCQGGGYIVSRRLLDGLQQTGACTRPLIWQALNVPEDVMMAIQCAAAGLRMYDVSQQGPRFGIDPECLSHSREELARSAYSIVHSIRGGMEEEFRRYFRERRSVARPLVHDVH